MIFEMISWHIEALERLNQFGARAAGIAPALAPFRFAILYSV